MDALRGLVDHARVTSTTIPSDDLAAPSLARRETTGAWLACLAAVGLRLWLGESADPHGHCTSGGGR